MLINPERNQQDPLEKKKIFEKFLGVYGAGRVPDSCHQKSPIWRKSYFHHQWFFLTPEASLPHRKQRR